MTTYNRPDELVMAESALAGEVQEFPDILRGWGITFDQTGGIPPVEWFNYIARRTDHAIRYFMQRGIVEWSATEDYPQGAYVQYAGGTYVSKRANINKAPNASANDWGLWALTPDQVTTLVGSGRLLRTTVFNRIGGVQMVSSDGGAPTAVGASMFNPLLGGKWWLVGVQAAGGGGAGAPGSASQGSVSGGGGGGTYALALIPAVAGPIAVTVGAGGLGGVNTGSAINGGASSFGALVTCPGGPASLTGVAGALLVGGTAQSAAATGANIYSQRGGGGVYGLQLSSTGSGVGGKGGSSHFGDGPNGPNQITSNGVAAVNFGTGGSGATSGPGNAGGATGGAGADGIIIVRELSGP